MLSLYQKKQNGGKKINICVFVVFLSMKYALHHYVPPSCMQKVL